MLEYNETKYLPSAEELPDSDEMPVDNELQELIPGLLKAILLILWAERIDWFFGIDMGIYYHPDKPPIVPDGFLSLYHLYMKMRLISPRRWALFV